MSKRYRSGVAMRSSVVVIGDVFFVIGIAMILFFWPIIGFETKNTFHIEEVEGGETLRYVGEITDINESGEYFVLELDNSPLDAYTKEEGFELNEKVFVTIEFGENLMNWDEHSYQVEKVPTLLGTLGMLIVLFSFIIIIVGFTSRKKTLEELVKFSAQPGVQSSLPQEPQQAPPSSKYFTEPAPQSMPSSLSPQPGKIQQITCPKCGKVFAVQVETKHMKISCPNCGLAGVL